MKYLLYTFLILLLLAINVELTGWFLETSWHVNLLLILCVLSAMESKTYDFLFFAIVAGIILDIYNPHNFGAYSFMFLLIAWIVNWGVKNFLVYEINFKISTILLSLSYGVSEILLWLGTAVFKLDVGVNYSSLSFGDILLYQMSGLVIFLLFALPLYFVWQRVSWIVKKLYIQAVS